MPPQQNAWNLIPFPTNPGIYRDGTTFDSTGVVDAQQMRWHWGRFRKIGGHYATLTAPVTPLQLVGPVRQLFGFWGSSSGYIHSGSAAKLERIALAADGTSSAVSDRTPAGFAAMANNNWQFDAIYDSVSSYTSIIAHCTDNLADIAAGSLTSVYNGDISGTAALTSVGWSVDGGIVCLQPYLFGYGSNGVVYWTAANKPADLSAANGGSGGAGARIAASKIIKGLPARGGSSGPAGLFWSLRSLIRATFSGSTTVFSFQTISEKITTLSSTSIIEYDGRFFWPGVDRFYVYDGSLRELPNPFNYNFFFDNLNYTWRQKVWARYDQFFGEIWWFFPYGSATECNRAIIYNIRENAWYDTEMARSAGIGAGVYRYPFMTDTENNATLWQHERGYDQVSGATTTAIPYYLESRVFALSQGQDGSTQSNWLYADSFEPDMTQVGDMTLLVRGRQYARSSLSAGTSYTVTPTTEKNDIRDQYRETLFKLSGSAVGSYVESGRALLRMRVGDGQ